MQRILTGNNKWLIKSGNPAKLDEVWATLYTEYSDLIKDDKSSRLLELKKTIHTTDINLVVFQLIKNQLLYKRNEELIMLLKRYPYNFVYTFVDLEKDLKRAESLMKNELVKLKRAEGEHNKLMKSEGKEWTMYDYIEQLAVLSQFAGRSLRIKEITVAEYAAELNRYKTHCKALENVNRK